MRQKIVASYLHEMLPLGKAINKKKKGHWIYISNIISTTFCEKPWVVSNIDGRKRTNRLSRFL